MRRNLCGDLARRHYAAGWRGRAGASAPRPLAGELADLVVRFARDENRQNSAIIPAVLALWTRWLVYGLDNTLT